MATKTIELTKAEMELPDFHFKEVEELYIHDLTIPDDVYQSLLTRDRKLIIEDLEKVLQHGIDKHKVFDTNNVSNKNTFFVWHALFLLNDLQALESIGALLNFCRLDEEVIAFYLGDGMGEFGWQIFYTLGNDNLRLLVDFSKHLPDDYSIRTEIIEALKQIVLHQPERKLEIESYLRELLQHVTTTTLHDDAYIDTIADKVLETIAQLQFTRLYAEIERVFDENKVPSFFERNWKDFERKYVLQKPDKEEIRQDMRTTKEIYLEYLEVQKELAADNDDDDDESEKDEEEVEEDKNKSYINYEESHTPYIKKEPDIGRNEPCPCGSGKKYKKCHGKS